MQRLVPLIEEKGAEVHISLSRTFVLKYEEISSFKDDLTQVFIVKATTLLHRANCNINLKLKPLHRPFDGQNLSRL